MLRKRTHSSVTKQQTGTCLHFLFKLDLSTPFFILHIEFNMTHTFFLLSHLNILCKIFTMQSAKSSKIFSTLPKFRQHIVPIFYQQIAVDLQLHNRCLNLSRAYLFIDYLSHKWTCTKSNYTTDRFMIGHWNKPRTMAQLVSSYLAYRYV